MTSGLAIYDTMQYILNPICTWCVGQAASMGSLLLAAGTPGMRHSLPNSRIMIHQPSGGARVSAGPRELLWAWGWGSRQKDQPDRRKSCGGVNVLKCRFWGLPWRSSG